jgi:hypothetical protein
VLGLEYYELKKRVEAAGSSCSGKTASPTFVEVVTSPPRSPSECVVEFENAFGGKMKIQVMGESTPDLCALLRLFLERRACSR